MKIHACLALALVAAAGCSGPKSTTGEGTAEKAKSAPTAAEALDEVLAGAHRTEEERARDQYRHPKETLLFFGAEPTMTIVEVYPGGGWYTNVLAPFIRLGGGVYYAAGIDPNASDRSRDAVAAFETKYAHNADLYGTVRMTVLGGGPIAPEGTADLVLTFRNVHNWMNSGTAEANFKAFYDALKPGGVLGVVEHRAPEDAAADFEGSSGYVKVSTVKKFAEEAGFEFDGESEVNANPKDTKDHPFGVWTLPPVRRSSAIRGQEDPNFDHAKYDAIGESDRMTLKFRKPLSADGELLQ